MPGGHNKRRVSQERNSLVTKHGGIFCFKSVGWEFFKLCFTWQTCHEEHVYFLTRVRVRKKEEKASASPRALKQLSGMCQWSFGKKPSMKPSETSHRVPWSILLSPKYFHIHLSFLVTHRYMSLWIPVFWHFHRTLLGSSMAHKHKEPANGTCFTHRVVNQPVSAEKPTYVTGNASICVNFPLMLDILSWCWSKTF